MEKVSDLASILRSEAAHQSTEMSSIESFWDDNVFELASRPNDCHFVRLCLTFQQTIFDYSYLFCFCLSTSEFDELFQDMITHYILQTEQYIQLFRIFISDDKKFDHSFCCLLFCRFSNSWREWLRKYSTAEDARPQFIKTITKSFFKTKNFQKMKWNGDLACNLVISVCNTWNYL